MARVVWKQDAYMKAIRAQTIREMNAIGPEVKAFVKRHTPVLSGHAQRSVYFVVIDETGARVGGDTTDDNGEAVPSSFPDKANGSIRLIIGANAPYYIWIEIGARGRPGHQAMSRGCDLMEQRLRTRLQELKRVRA